jgi:hypothetical protein
MPFIKGTWSSVTILVAVFIHVSQTSVDAWSSFVKYPPTLLILLGISADGGPAPSFGAFRVFRALSRRASRVPAKDLARLANYTN